MYRGWRVLLIAVLLVSSPDLVRAQSGEMLLESDASRTKLEAARRHLFRYRMHQAELILRELATRSDGLPAASYHLTLAALHRALMSDESRHFDVLYGRLDSLDALLVSGPASPWRDYMQSEAHLWRAVAHLKRGQYVRGAWAARSAYRGYDRLIGAYPRFYEAYKGLGLLHLAIGSMPKSYRFILKVLGYSGSVSGGLDELEQAYRHSSYSREEAGMYLALTHVMLFISEGEGRRITERLYDEDPESPLYAHVYGFVLLSSGRADEAADVLLPAVERSETPAYFYDHYLDFYAAEAMFRKDRFEEAITYYRRYLDRHPGPALKAMAHLGTGLALEMLGRRDEAVHYYREVETARTFDTDEAARRAAEERLSAPMTDIERDLLLGRNAYDCARYDEANRLLLRALNHGEASLDERAEARYRLGRVSHAEERLDAALEHYRRAVELRGEETSRWAPWSQLFIGEILAHRQRWEEARTAYRAALAYRGRFDYYQALDQSARAALELLEARAVGN